MLNTSNKKLNPSLLIMQIGFTKLKYINFSETCIVIFTINKMLTFDNVRIRLERAIFKLYEFNYMILQAYDFYQLYLKNCILQIGGSDQWKYCKWR